MSHSSLQLLRNAEVYAPEPLGRRHLLIGGGRILWLGRDLPRFAPALGVAELDLEGRRLVPGLIDGHAHLTGGGGECGFGSRVPPVPLSRYTLAGVTSVVGVLGTDDTVRDTASLLAQARTLREEGLSAWCHCGGYHVPPRTLTGSVRGDIAHIDPIIGVGEVAISDHRSSQPTLDELLRIAADAHVAGLMTGKAGILHLHLGDGPRGLELVRRALEVSELPPRVFNPTHVNRRKALFAEALELAARGCVIDLTAFPSSGPDEWSAAEGLLRYWDAGLPPQQVTVSSDGGGCLPAFDDAGRIIHMEVGEPGELWRTLTELLRRGVPLERALPPFTVNPARLLRLAGKGEIAVDGDADLLVLDADHGLWGVMARGVWHVYGGALRRRGRFEPESGQGGTRPGSADSAAAGSSSR
ncbi:MAG TPA: beta-aspartyl-peptidase [Candidatus Competibacteraceae bacterium]|nr:beta-aspartyl-peptidase [Candidatus Competibacteraceae bacterium]